MPHDNSVRNFEHVSHMMMSVSKLLSRIAAPNIELEGGKNDAAANLYDHVYCIMSDLLTQFAAVLSALIHNVDHVGLPNFVVDQPIQEPSGSLQEQERYQANLCGPCLQYIGSLTSATSATV
jgi:hypothetical protein